MEQLAAVQIVAAFELENRASAAAQVFFAKKAEFAASEAAAEGLIGCVAALIVGVGNAVVRDAAKGKK